MGKNSHIEWTHHTFNPWWGCAKVSPACAHCYAEAWAKRVGSQVWGKRAPRRFFGAAHWLQPIAWNAEAEKKRKRSRVFCASMADVFEDRRDLDSSREKLWDLVEVTPSLDWLLLTKRPEAVRKLVRWKAKWPDNVWLGTTVENQEWAGKRLPYLIENPANVRFLSCEPLLGSLDLSKFVPRAGQSPIHWIIAGGESGAHARPMDPAWVRSLRDFCTRKRVAFHFKQWGHWGPVAKDSVLSPKVQLVGESMMIASGKGVSGRILDGRTHDEFPIADL